VVLYGYETVSLTLRENHKLKVFEKRVLRQMFRLKRDEEIGGWRNEDSSPSIIGMMESRGIRWTGHIAHVG
jgi:hypothetical protein